MTDRHRVWFERPIVPQLAAEVASRVTMLGPGTDDDPFAGLATAAGVLAGTSRCDAGFMDRAPGLQVIARTGIGVDGVDLVEATRRGIAVTNTPDGPTVSTAEHAVTLIMMVAKNVKRAESALRAGVSNGYYVTHEAIELDGKVLGLVGFGRIARRVARIANGIGMQVMAHDPFLPEDSFPAGATRAETLDELLRAADVVSIHVPLTDASRGMFGSQQFGQMKPGAIFVNTARGGLVDGDALHRCTRCRPPLRGGARRHLPRAPPARPPVAAPGGRGRNAPRRVGDDGRQGPDLPKRLRAGPRGPRRPPARTPRQPRRLGARGLR